MTIAPLGMAFEAVAFTCLRPIRNGRVNCGFVQNESPCQYTLAGLGCTVRGFTDAELVARARLGLGEGCHWTYHSEHLKIRRA
jgi:hypothetical protein